MIRGTKITRIFIFQKTSQIYKLSDKFIISSCYILERDTKPKRKLSTEEIRNKFKEFVGNEKYEHFVLTLYEAFPLRKRLFFWQEQLLTEFSTEFDIEPINFEYIHKIFNHCPIHHVELKNDTVLIVDGNEIIPTISHEKEKRIFPMANINAPRDLERFNYPKDVDVFYCEICRKARK